MKFLITGANGQLAREFSRALDTHSTVGMDRERLDISDFHSVSGAVSSYSPDIVLNCAAYNLVDTAEDDFDTAFRVNALGTKNLAAACEKHNALMVHFSTDYVFDGEKNDFYTEEDKPNPINRYGESKLSGERFLAEETEDFLIFRVSWVFGEGGRNFLGKLSGWAEKNKVLRIVCDQISVPTYTEDIVKAVLLAVKDGLRGVYHLTNNGYSSRYEVSRYYLEKMGSNNLILPVSSGYFQEQAGRPYFSAMSNAKISRALSLSMPHWKDAINRFIKRITG